jgi:hypothetical protein
VRPRVGERRKGTRTKKAWDETTYELNKRIETMIQKADATDMSSYGISHAHQEAVFSQKVGQDLLRNAIALAEAKVSIIPHEFYAPYETVARNRIPRDPNDWFTVALALAVEGDIWTLDNDFLGCGIATWTTDTLLTHLDSSNY